MSRAIINYRMSMPKEMVAQFQEELAQTPKWKWLKRLQLKRNIEFWEKS